MEIDELQTDEAVLAELGGRLRRRRVDRAWTQADLARHAGISKRTVERLEDGASVQLTRLLRVLRALELLPGLDALVPPTRTRPMEELRRQGRARQRAAPRARKGAPTERWTWGDEE